MALSTHDGDYHVTGRISSGSLSIPANTITDAGVASNAAIARTKYEQSWSKELTQTGTVVAATQYVHIIKGATADLVDVRATITETIATGADRTVTIDVQKSTAAGAFATIMTSTIVFTNVSVLRTVSVGTVAAGGTNMVVGDILKVTVAVAGAAGNQALGLVVTLLFGEDAV